MVMYANHRAATAESDATGFGISFDEVLEPGLPGKDTGAKEWGAFQEAAEKGFFDDGVCGDIQPGVISHIVSQIGRAGGSPKNFVERGGRRVMKKWLMYLPLPGSKLSVRLYSTIDLQASGPWPRVETAVIVVHGALRNADDYFCQFSVAAHRSAEHARDASKLLVIAPQFDVAKDPSIQGKDVMTFTPFGWWRGFGSEMGNHTSSFTVLDALVQFLRSKAGTSLPNLRQVVVTGHSAGATFVMHHAQWTRIPNEASGVSVRWVPANPTVYLYYDSRRWAYSDPTGPYQLVNTSASEHGEPDFWCKAPSLLSRSNRYPLGLEMTKKAPEFAPLPELLKRFAERDVTIMLGLNDTCNCQLHPGQCVADPAHGWPVMLLEHVCLGRAWAEPGVDPLPKVISVTADFAPHCDHLLQGPNRLQRGRLFYRYLRELYGKETARIKEVPGIGHIEMRMFASREMLDTVFMRS
eukprot:TRINITY_DN28014_c0_g1_i1.p1 TRINITY_DN28014_c0_g1~~TRINITY_DN28014_c0_g1_i1.p1  ORF type:complete len:498 (-),score=62.26 TRINITY_DN28014_c0_g1_i1:233-1630(-)